MIIDPRQFAFSVVQSSSPELSIQDKINLYEKAYAAIEEHNKVAQEQKDRQDAEQTLDFLDALNKSDVF